MEKKFDFQKLTPVNNVNIDIYDTAFNFIFKNNDLKNIAISGSYGSGKSSILESYKVKHKEVKFIHISLAHFNYNKESDNTTIGTLEGKIINQLIHKIPPKNIQQTIFKIKNKENSKSICLYTVGFILSIVSLLSICFHTKWNDYVEKLFTQITQNSHEALLILKKFLEISSNDNVPLLSGLVLFIISCILIYNIIKAQTNKNIFRKITLQGNEIEIFGEEKDSCFDKYLNEILYLFRNSGANVIVFEDIDRYDQNKIFERLYEINNLINIQLCDDKKNVIRFFYLIRDDVFNSKDRTKFFDYIIPIVPVINNSNAIDKMIKLFTDSGIISIFDKKFLRNLSLYIDDMRLLKNIYNEFLIYYNILNKIKLNGNKMLAIITYKNLFPKDFIDLQLNKGYVYSVFDKKDEIQKHEKEIAESEVQILRNKYAEKKDGLSEATQIKEEKILNKKVENLEKRISLLQYMDLKDLITNENDTLVFDISNKSNSLKDDEYYDLLRFLIRDGHIDESYPDYMTYFYEESISRTDKNFLKSVTDRKALGYEYKLENIDEILASLTLLNFDQHEILNLDLLEYLLENDECEEYLDRLILQLRDTNNLEFISQYYETERNLPQFVLNLNWFWPEFFSIILDEETLKEYQIKSYSIYTLCQSNENTIDKVNINNCLLEYISNSSDYLKIDNPDVSMLLKEFIYLKIRFKSIDSIGINRELLDGVYTNSLYEINLHNINLMLQEFYKVTDEEKLKSQNTTLIYIDPNSPLFKYICDNINQYIRTITSSNSLLNDEEDVVLFVLNNKDLEEELKVNYIELLETKITDISQIENIELWVSILENNLMEYNEDNIYNYYLFNQEELSDTLINFINDKSIERTLSFRGFYDKFKKEDSKDSAKESLNKFTSFVISCSQCKELDCHRYEQLVSTMGYIYNQFSINGIADEKISILINNNRIKMNANNLEFIRNNYKKNLFNFIEKNIKTYIEDTAANTFKYDELIEILSWNISDELKVKLIGITDESIPIHKKDYSIDVKNYIIVNNFDRDELSYIFSEYATFNESTRELIYTKAVDEIVYIIDNRKSVNLELINKLISDVEIDQESKALLLRNVIPIRNPEKTKELLKIAGFDKQILKVLDKGSQPKIVINKENTIILQELSRKGYITRYSEDSKKAGVYKISRQGVFSKGIQRNLL